MGYAKIMRYGMAGELVSQGSLVYNISLMEHESLGDGAKKETGSRQVLYII